MSKIGSTGALFWTSYSDLMTTLFFVMLVLFIVVTIAMGRIVQVGNNATETIDSLIISIEKLEDSVK